MEEKYAIMSLYNKDNSENLAKSISKYRKILATGGTYRYLKNKGVNVLELKTITGIEESKILKTLNTKVYEMIFSGNIDVVAVNLYPFEEKPCIGNIDIGGVTLLRAAAKNFDKVLVISSPKQYPEVIEKFPAIDKNLRLKFACKAFEIVKDYDTKIAEWFCNLNAIKRHR